MTDKVYNETIYNIMDANMRRQMDLAHQLFQYKNRKYGNAIVLTGLLGAIVEIVGAAARLRPMVLRPADHGRSEVKKLTDILKDILNYAGIALMMIEMDNWEGEYNDQAQ